MLTNLSDIYLYVCACLCVSIATYNKTIGSVSYVRHRVCVCMHTSAQHIHVAYLRGKVVIARRLLGNIQISHDRYSVVYGCADLGQL